MAQPIRRALISVSDKTGVVDFCRKLAARGIALLSTGGTFKLLEAEGISVTEVSAHTGFPEIMAGRVKTLHPKIHGGLLGRRGMDDAVMAEHGIEAIDLLVVNLYPFVETINKPDCTYDLAVENIDIGGPAMLRAAAKNHAHVAVVVEPADYDRVLTELDDGQGALNEATRRRLALKAFQLTARYDAAIAAYLSAAQGERFPEWWQTASQHKQTLRYGENPHQQAAFFTDAKPLPGTVAYAAQLQGKELSYNNIADTDTALECVKSFTEQP
ncbi:MAG: bifunctional phosphoribosylaminoimidazolecarboxamide formyltransferase/IMP cyclohydrolase, partial [Methylococcales bacterium]|nr:bifunctional phosphoribosylaminoimidazolecarboxamide formyltransferase/IMP cyclohydrolase [Methylococcales bacterium]